MPKKKIIFYCICLISLLMFVTVSILFYKRVVPIMHSNSCMKKESNANLYSPFSVNKIVYFSTANAESSINQNSSFTINNLYQITDIAIFINNNSNGNYTNENTLKKVTLSDIKFSLLPSSGEPNLYYKNLNNFAKNVFDDKQKINQSIVFETTSESEIDYSTPVLYNNTANPITLCYVNSNITTNYTLADNISNLSYDGNLLKQCNITLNSIACKVSFNMIIENNSDETFTCPISLNIPLSTESSTLYDGSLTLTDKVNYKFIKIK